MLPAVVAAAVLLLVLWPTAHSGRRLLQTWGIPQPQPEQVREAVRYLRQRRILCVALFLLFPSVAGLIDRDRLAGVAIFVPLLIAMLVAEAVATLRPVSGFRSASLDRRTWQDLVPRWAVRTMAAVVIGTLVLVVFGTVAGAGTSWLAVGYLVACLLFVSGLVALAVRRPAVADEAVDAALRTRTARVAVGIGFGWTGSAVSVAIRQLRLPALAGPEPVARPGWLTDGVVDALAIAEFAIVAGAILCWLGVAAPGRRSLATSR